MTVASAAVAGARPLFATARQTGVIGANNRIRAAIIGCGGRGNAVARDWQLHKDTVFVAACDVDDMRTQNSATNLMGRQDGAKVDAVGDYRRILDRNDVDALLIGTPDHWHTPMVIEGMSAGKDIYCEKPVSNTVEAAVAMRDAARKSNRIVQIGTQQRSWVHFMEAAKMFQDGYIGSVRYIQMSPPGGGGGGGAAPDPATFASRQPADPIPPGFNWEMYQGPAPRKPYLTARRGFRGWWDYGGGNLTDWGVHLVDVMAWLMQLDNKAPLLTSAVSQPTNALRDPERTPASYAVTWQYDNFIATLGNVSLPGVEHPEENYGDWFFGQRGVLLLNRLGYDFKASGGGRGGFGGGGRGAAPGAPGAAGATTGPVQTIPAPAGGAAPAAGAAPAGRAGGAGGGRGGGRGGQAPAAAAGAAPQAPFEPKRVWDLMGRSEAAGSKFADATRDHVRNFLDCMRSRQQPRSPVEAGFAASLPCLLANVAIRTEKTVKWDGNKVILA